MIKIIKLSSSHKQSKKLPFKRKYLLDINRINIYISDYSVNKTINSKKKNSSEQGSSPNISQSLNKTTKSKKNINKHSQEQSSKKLHI